MKRQSAARRPGRVGGSYIIERGRADDTPAKLLKKLDRLQQRARFRAQPAMSCRLCGAHSRTHTCSVCAGWGRIGRFVVGIGKVRP